MLSMSEDDEDFTVRFQSIFDPVKQFPSVHTKKRTPSTAFFSPSPPFAILSCDLFIFIYLFVEELLAK